MRSSLMILKSLKNENFRVNVYNGVIFANKKNTFISITSNNYLSTMCCTIIVKNLLTGIEDCAKDICLEFLESDNFLNSKLLITLIANTVIPDHDFNFSTFIKNTRHTLCLTQKQFAKEINVPISTFRKWEQGVTTPSQIVVKSIVYKFFSEWRN